MGAQWDSEAYGHCRRCVSDFCLRGLSVQCSDRGLFEGPLDFLPEKLSERAGRQCLTCSATREWCAFCEAFYAFEPTGIAKLGAKGNASSVADLKPWQCRRCQRQKPAARLSPAAQRLAKHCKYLRCEDSMVCPKCSRRIPIAGFPFSAVKNRRYGSGKCLT